MGGLPRWFKYPVARVDGEEREGRRGVGERREEALRRAKLGPEGGGGQGWKGKMGGDRIERTWTCMALVGWGWWRCLGPLLVTRLVRERSCKHGVGWGRFSPAR